ncbi:hypothetical protein M404DRAFT_1008258 [Pisolithus tinctorius Marx 270]|uniref:Uncharacterized protein n=1 Tax=Pisolithus tinctorius Marx 270 TaxID=870435 RepID=A0A0C3IBT3_PISTI|nr:hypothetical protein M404DRAFT_1008258 [Pisolithus tinctorius Marx 270]
MSLEMLIHGSRSPVYGYTAVPYDASISHYFALPRRGRSPLHTGGTYFGTDSLTYVYVSIRQQLLALDPLTNRIALGALR